MSEKEGQKSGQKWVKKCPKWVIFGVIFETPKIIIFPLGAPVKSQKVGQKGVKKEGPKMTQK